jgi:Chromate transport protein ChrA
MKNNKAQDLFFSFLKLGLSAFGGPAMVAYIQELAVEKKKWLDSETSQEVLPFHKQFQEQLQCNGSLCWN